jgi:hypothetical protein
VTRANISESPLPRVRHFISVTGRDGRERFLVCPAFLVAAQRRMRSSSAASAGTKRTAAARHSVRAHVALFVSTTTSAELRSTGDFAKALAL